MVDSLHFLSTMTVAATVAAAVVKVVTKMVDNSTLCVFYVFLCTGRVGSGRHIFDQKIYCAIIKIKYIKFCDDLHLFIRHFSLFVIFVFLQLWILFRISRDGSIS